MSNFRLYPEPQHWWSLEDYGAVLTVMENIRRRPHSVLEFGPGSSTLALIEGGAGAIDTCEDDPHWAQLWHERLHLKHPCVLNVRPYTWKEPLYVHGIGPKLYDFALIDGPRDNSKRPACIEYALRRCDAVMVALECAGGDDYLSAQVRHLAEKHGRAVEIMETGPLAGAFAVLT